MAKTENVRNLYGKFSFLHAFVDIDNEIKVYFTKTTEFFAKFQNLIIVIICCADVYSPKTIS